MTRLAPHFDPADVYEQEMIVCPACDYAPVELLGQLGDRTHFRCRSCAMIFSTFEQTLEDPADLLA